MYNNPYQTYVNSFMPQRQEVVRVNGRNGANAYQMAPNSSILLLDETAPVIWLKTTDGASYPTITGYTITPLVEEQQVNNNNYAELESRIAKLEEVIKNNEKSNVKPVKTIIKQQQQ